ncbi:unnamed protein product [Aphanomyces euteiches]|uniref:Protein kinase domain-containing protein n=1 Tax=Aphanomyces euteiches TaxID=100861 RepID=A0A6G0WSZ3_9STRA|nr:hypothetical protein Ae201684_011972 [Aphanomyces euteiches]KAH9055955.1 hypothetical protein Ae201684P_021695 [Aphanomyces euteiches]KAH9144426.1 hypothetical protein AeRB84_011651 [Aphanomyces euteiches]
MERYRVQRILATALYGDVLLCHDRRTGARVAIKRMNLAAAQEHKSLVEKRHVPEDVDFEAHVHYAVRAAGGHRNILHMQRDFVEDDCLHFVYDYCAGGDLLDLLRAHDRFTRDIAMNYFRDIVSAVQHLHKLGFAHRDLSLENVLLDASDVCQVIDFGVACSTSTSHSSRVGKAFYMAPEVVAGKTYDGCKADVWSLGILLFEMLTGRPLFDLAATTNPRFELFQAQGLAAIIDTNLVDENCMTLLSDMLSLDPHYRPSLATVLAHPAIVVPSKSGETMLASFMTNVVGAVASSGLAGYFNRMVYSPWTALEPTTVVQH